MRKWQVTLNHVDKTVTKYAITYTEDDLREAGVDLEDEMQVDCFLNLVAESDIQGGEGAVVDCWNDRDWEEDVEIEEL